MPNIVAVLAITFWIPISLLIFRLCSPVVAATIVLLGGLVILPAGYYVDFPGLPPIDRSIVASLGAFAGYKFLVPDSRKVKRGFHWPEKLILVFSLCGFLTATFNSDVLVYGRTVLPGLTMRDGVGFSFFGVVAVGLPFFVGSRLVRTEEDIQSILKVLIIFGLLYIPAILWENRMSPQLHATLYGYFPHSFGQHIRGDGYRPVGFASHGLELALFMVTTMIAAIGFGKTKITILKAGTWVPFNILFAGVLLCKSLASIFYGITLSCLMVFTRRKTQIRVITLLVFFVASYPVLRSFDLVPTDSLVDYAEKISPDRAASLEFRFSNEDALLDKARDRIWFGWGSWARHHVFDPVTGRDLSVIDGYWIILLGKFGVLGFASFFGLLLGPVYLAIRRLRHVESIRSQWVILTLVFIVLVRSIDLVPNAFITPVTLFLAGALYPFTVERKSSTPTRRRS